MKKQKRTFKMTINDLINEMENCEQYVYNKKRIRQEYNDALVNMIHDMCFSPKVEDMEREYQEMLGEL